MRWQCNGATSPASSRTIVSSFSSFHEELYEQLSLSRIHRLIATRMAESTLLNYLTLPNPILDCTKSSVGPNTTNAAWDIATALEDWPDFNYDILMQAHGHILQQQVALIPEPNPPLIGLEKIIFTEKTFEDILARAIMPQVSAVLSVA
jgi:hypothetical protein